MTRETLDFDIVIIGAGPAGLSAAIHLATLCKNENKPLSICVIEKASSVGAQIMSGAAIETRALDELLPDWQDRNPPIRIKASKDKFYYLTKKRAIRLPTPPPLRNDGNFIVSLEEVCRWLAQIAEQLGVAIFPGFAGVELLYGEHDEVVGVRLGDKGIDKDNQPTPQFQPGPNLMAKQTLLAEGCRGSLTKQLLKKFNLDKDACPQTYGLGVKELWEIRPENHELGTVMHTIGWPLDHHTYGGSFLYHFEGNKLAVGFAVGLDYENPYMDPFQELQRFKMHPAIRYLFEDAKRLCYGARAINEGGFQSLPKLSVPGALIIGDSAGFLNVPKIKGTHTAMKSGMVAAETIFEALPSGLMGELTRYTQNLKQSWLWKELYQARNIRPAFRKGIMFGMAYSALDLYILQGKAPWTFKNVADHTTLKPAAACKKIHYPKPDNKISFDKLSSVYLANTNHHEDQPCHLQILNKEIPIEVNLEIYDSPESRYCPAQVYEIVYTDDKPQLQINAANCVHCKTCDIKDPWQNINWVPPEGGDGPNYEEM